MRFAERVGRENVIASTDCGMGSRIHPELGWAKLEALERGSTSRHDAPVGVEGRSMNTRSSSANRPARIGAVALPQPVASSTNGPRRVVTQSLVDLVLEEVRRSILDGSLAPGAAVSIAELSDRLGVSHIPVREALRRLEGEGLVVLRRGRAATVAPLSVRDLEEVLELRALVESDTLARAVRLYTPKDLAAIEQAWEMLHIGPDDDVEAVFSRHQEFHRLLVRPAADEWRRRILGILWQAGERYVRLLIVSSDSSPNPDRVRDAHTPLLEAARSRSAREARRATLEHSQAAITLVSRILTRPAADDGTS